MDCVNKLLKLTTLNITNIPATYHARITQGQLAVRDAALTRLASDIFEIVSFLNPRDPGSIVEDTYNCSVEVIAFGVRDRDSRNIGPRYFLPTKSRAFDMPSKTYYFAEMCYLAELRREAMDLDILDYEKREFNASSRKRLGQVEYDDEIEHDGEGAGEDEYDDEREEW